MTQAEQTGTGGAPQGNQNAVKAKVVREAMRKSLAELGKGDVEVGLRKITDKVVRLAKEGEQWAAQEVFNRLEGRVAQAVEVTGANGGDLVIRDANTSIGLARRVAFVLAQGAIAKAKGSSEQPAAKQGA